MGGAAAVLAKACKDYAAGHYRWVAEVTSKVVLVDPNNRPARMLEANALEQLGYQAESGVWRNEYLMGAKELRSGVRALPLPSSSLAGLSSRMIMDAMAVHVDGDRAGTLAPMTLKWVFTDGGPSQTTIMRNGALSVLPPGTPAEASLSLHSSMLGGFYKAERTPTPQ